MPPPVQVQSLSQMDFASVGLQPLSLLQGAFGAGQPLGRAAEIIPIETEVRPTKLAPGE